GSPATAGWCGGAAPGTHGGSLGSRTGGGAARNRRARPAQPLAPPRGGGGASPAVRRLNGSDWQKTKARVRSAVAEIAQELVVLYQRRITSPGTAFAPATPWQHEMEAAFPYALTPDQAQAIADVKADMESDHPMDRLVCGDVGFG